MRGPTYVVVQLREADGRLGSQPQAPAQGQGADQGAVRGQACQAEGGVQQAEDVPPRLLWRAESVLSGRPPGVPPLMPPSPRHDVSPPGSHPESIGAREQAPGNDPAPRVLVLQQFCSLGADPREAVMQVTQDLEALEGGGL